MTFCIITHVVHFNSQGKYYAYAPYVNEMNCWVKNVKKVIIVAPIIKSEINSIHNFYIHDNISFIAVPQFSFTSIKNSFKAITTIPFVFIKIVKAMAVSNHIHLRCPGNMGLLGSFAQIIFPKKIKTAKYAGNWDVRSKQPLSYKIQKSILSSTFITKNMQVLVYGQWKNQTKNIKSFFTATYRESEIENIQPKSLKDTINFIFVGTLSTGKQPIYAIKIVEKLVKNRQNVILSIYGDGEEKQNLQRYINQNSLHNHVFLKGNVDKNQMKIIYQQTHFLLLPSKSEGWPKVVAEAMFNACLPIASNVSCVSYMLDNNKRGILLKLNLEDDIKQIELVISNQTEYNFKIKNALSWSHQFTIDKFEAEIKQLLQ